VRKWSFTVTEHEPDRPWIVTNRKHRTIELDDGASFFEWAAQHYPGERFTVELDPWSLTPGKP
jgi:hypothetical protein